MKIEKTEIENFQLRLYEPKMMDQYLQNAGFKNIRRFMRYDRRLTDVEDAEVIVYECRK